MSQRVGFYDVNRFRTRRGAILAAQIKELATSLGRKVRVLDIGGRSAYWKNVDTSDIEHIELLNFDAGEFAGDSSPPPLFSAVVGDGRRLEKYADGSVDMVHSNSVIEHVGSWEDMEMMAREVKRVGNSGWVQTPAFEFPIEPHFRAPFLHWFAQPIRRRLLWMSPFYRKGSTSERRSHVDRINLLSKREMVELFPDATIYVERIVLPKSYVARWGEGV